MATLSADVQSRYSSTRLIQLTNPDDTSATSINTSILNNAITDVQADFETYAGVEYDSTEARHVSIAVEGVMIKLQKFQHKPVGNIEDAEDRWFEKLEALRMVTNNDRIKPKTTSELTPADEVAGSEKKRPQFDINQNFNNIVPKAPHS